jgi:site-specific recombinase XerD
VTTGSVKVLRAVPLRRPPNADLRSREYLTEREVATLISAAKRSRNGLRDSTMLLLGIRHGLRVSELCGLQWTQVEFESALLHVRRAKNGVSNSHPIRGDELRYLRSMKRQSSSPWIFLSERGSPFTTAGFASLIERTGKRAQLGFKVHPHMLRHACGFILANRGVDTRTLQAFLGHRSISSTVRYTEISVRRFQNIWGCGFVGP